MTAVRPVLDAIIVDDAPLFRGMVAAVLRDHATVRELADLGPLTAEIASRTPDLLILDIRLPPTQTVEGLDAAVRIRASHPGVGVLLLSHHVELHHLDRLLTGGDRGFGYLLKERVAGIDAFVRSVVTVARGGHVIDPEVVAAILEQRRSVELVGRLTPAERTVLTLMAQGLSNSGIAQRLQLSPKTVEAHIHRILTRLDLPHQVSHNRRVLAVLAHLRGGDPQRATPR